MGTIAVHEFISIDGVFEDPKWTFDYGFEPKMGEAIGGLMGSCRAILLGRNTYQLFAPAWSAKSAADDPGAPFMNDSPKYVVSTTLRDPDWRNTKVIGGYSAQAIRELKEGVEGGIYVSGSGTLVRAMLADGLVDELHLFVYPVALGAGGRLFGESERVNRFELAGSEHYENGVVHLGYHAAGD